MMLTTRHAAALPGSVIITAALVYGMQALIDIGPAAVTEPPARLPELSLRVPEDSPVQPIIDKPPQPAPVERPPATPSRTVPNGVPAIGVRVAPPPADPSLGGGVLGGAAFDSGTIALRRVQPLYPSSLANRGIEGYVIVEFGVTAAGTVTDAVVVESSHRGFEKAALTAVAGFKYRPRVVAGQPQPVSGLRYMFTFELEK
ncbi:MAG: TonB family protein [Pseudomonadota bacterium]